MADCFLEPETTPKYPKLPGADKYRRLARQSLKDLTPEQLAAYAKAIHSGIRSLNHDRSVPNNPRVSCASGYPYSDIKGIFAAVKNMTRASHAATDKLRYGALIDNGAIEHMYAKAMAEKKVRKAMAEKKVRGADLLY